MRLLAPILALWLSGCAVTPLTPLVEYPDGKPIAALIGGRDLWQAYCEALGYDGCLDGAEVVAIRVYRRDSLAGVPGLAAMSPTIPAGKRWAGACRYDGQGRAELSFARWHWALRLMRHELHHARLWRLRGLERLAMNQHHGARSWEAIEHARGAEWPKKATH